MKTGAEIYTWISEQLDAGCTVYAHTYLRTIKISPKYRECLRLNGTNCEVQMGKRWDSLNFISRLTATAPKSRGISAGLDCTTSAVDQTWEDSDH